MALDLKKEINFSEVLGKFGRGSRGGSSAFPSKSTMNLYQGDEQSTDIRKVILVGILLTIGIALFVKFGVLDQLDMLNKKEGELAEQRSLLAATNASAGEYDSVKESFDAFTARYGEGSADAIAVLDMVEQRVMPVTTVTSISLADEVLTLTLYNVSLDTVGNLAKDLENQEMVQSVNVSTATTQNAEGQNTVSTLVVTLVTPEGKES